MIVARIFPWMNNIPHGTFLTGRFSPVMPGSFRIVANPLLPVQPAYDRSPFFPGAVFRFTQPVRENPEGL